MYFTVANTQGDQPIWWLYAGNNPNGCLGGRNVFQYVQRHARCGLSKAEPRPHDTTSTRMLAALALARLAVQRQGSGLDTRARTLLASSPRSVQRRTFETTLATRMAP